MQTEKALLRKKVSVFLILAVCLSTVVFSQTENIKIRVRVRKANVRDKPSMNGEIIAVVTRGRILQVDGKEGKWYYVRLPLQLEGYALPGYIHQSTVEVLGDKPSPAERGKRVKKADEGPQKYGAGLLMGSAFPSKRDYKAGLIFNGNFSYSISDKFSLELALQVFGSGTDGVPQGLSAGSLTVVPVHLSVRRHFPLDVKSTSFVSAGIGYNFIGFSLDDTSFDREETVKNALGFHLGGGVEYFFKENLAVGADLKYVFINTSGSWSYTDPGLGRLSGSIDSINLNSVIICIGIKYFF